MNTYDVLFVSRMNCCTKTTHICSCKRDCTHNKRLMKNMSLLAIKDGIDIIRSRDHDMNFSWNMVAYTSRLLRRDPTYIIFNDSILCSSFCVPLADPNNIIFLDWTLYFNITIKRKSEIIIKFIINTLHWDFSAIVEAGRYLGTY